MSRRVCAACGTRIDHPGTTRAGAGQARSAIDATVRAVAGEENAGTDLTTSRRLLASAERAHGEGAFGKAVDYAKAARRAIDLTRQRAKLVAAIQAVDERIQVASRRGLDTTAFARNLVRAREALERYDYAAATRWFRKASVRIPDSRDDSQTRVLLETAERDVAGAGAQGASVTKAEKALAKARTAAKEGSSVDVVRFVRAAREAADDARRSGRAETVLRQVGSEIAAAKALGADTSSARKLLKDARAALRRGAFGEVTDLAQGARTAVREAARVAKAEASIRGAERELRMEERRGGDMTRAKATVADARSALQGQDYARVRGLVDAAVAAVREGGVLRRLRESVSSLEQDREDLVKMGAGLSDFDAALTEARTALDRGDVAAVRGQIAAARRAAEHAREEHYRRTMRGALEFILRRAQGGGVDPEKARDVLKEIEAFVSDGRAVEIRPLLEARLGPPVPPEAREISARITRLQESIHDVRRAGMDVRAIEEQTAAAHAAIEQDRIEEAVRIADEVQGAVDVLHGSLRASAEEAVAGARDAVGRVPEGASTEEPSRILDNAQRALQAGRLYDAMEFARIATVVAERARAMANEIATGGPYRREHGRRALPATIAGLDRDLEAISSEGVDVSAARRLLSAAREAMAAEQPDAAQEHVRAAEEIARNLDAALEPKEAAIAATTETMLREASEQGFTVEGERVLFHEAVAEAGHGRVARALRMMEAIGASIEERRRRRAAENAREEQYRGTMRGAIEAILRRAQDGGVDPEKARDVLKEIEDFVSDGRAVQIQPLLETRLGPPGVRGKREVSSRITRLQESIHDVRRAGMDVRAIEEQTAAAHAAIEQDRIEEAVRIADEVQGAVDALHGSLRASAEEAIARARDFVERASEGGTLEEPGRIIENAQHALRTSRPFDAMEFARIAIVVAERAKEQRDRAAAETRRHDEERLQAVQGSITSLERDLEAIALESADVSDARKSLEAAREAVAARQLDSAEGHLRAAETLAQGLRQGLEREAAVVAADTERMLREAAKKGFSVEGELILHREAVEEAGRGRASRALRMLRAIGASVEERRRRRAAEDQDRISERALQSEQRLAEVQTLIVNLSGADIEIDGAEEELMQVKDSIRDGSFDEADARMARLEKTARDLKVDLRGAARELIDRARGRVNTERSHGFSLEPAASALEQADAHFAKESYADAVELARTAEERVDAAIRSDEDLRAAMDREERDRGRALLVRVRGLVDQLAKADIEMVGAKEELGHAEEALEQRRYADVHAGLAGTLGMAESLAEGLRKAANDLVVMAEGEIAEYRSRKIRAPRAESVLENAREAIRDGRFVEAIEYKKVIEDILADAERAAHFRALESRFLELESEILSLEAEGTPMGSAKELIARARQEMGAGRLDSLAGYAKQVEETVRLARVQQTPTRRGTGVPPSPEAQPVSGPGLQETLGIALPGVRGTEPVDREASERPRGKDGTLAVGPPETQTRTPTEAHLNALREMVAEAESLGAAEQLEALVGRARIAIEAGRPEEVGSLVTEARRILDAKRNEQNLARYRSRLRAIGELISRVERAGAPVAEARKFLRDAEDAIARSDFGKADVLLKQAEVSANVQIQNFIKNRYPKLALSLPTTGFQANVWNRVVIKVANSGTFAARNVTAGLSGDVEVKGIEPIAELAVDEPKFIEIGMRPERDGEIPLDVHMSYQRLFDENRYEVRDIHRIKVERTGTYLVEDVFLIHSDGRLIAHESRKFREEVDEDIFSGMLAVVQEFVKDSFRQRSRVGLKRLDFGDSKILIERSPNTFLATVVVGQEPPLLTIYMVEVLTQVEAKYGDMLRNWSGLLQEVEGASEILKRLLLVTDSRTADIGELSTSPVTATAKALQAAAASGADTSEIERLLAEATGSLEADLETAWGLVSRARERATEALAEMQGRAEKVLAETRIAIGELKDLGVDVSAAEALLRDAEAAFAEGRYDKVRDATEKIRAALERAKSDVAAKKVEADLARLVSQIREVRAMGIEVHEAEAYLTRIQDAMQRRDHRHTEEYVWRARDAIDRARRQAVTARARHEIEGLIGITVEMRRVGVDVSEAEGAIARAEAAVHSGRIREAEALLESVRDDVHKRGRDLLAERYPRVFFGIPAVAFEANAWNRVPLSIENKGDWPATDLEIVFLGPVEVIGPTRVERLEPKETKTLQLGLRPQAEGQLSLDMEVRYRRPLDEAHYQATDSKAVRIEQAGTYPVQEALLLTLDGRLVTRESRFLQAEAADDRDIPMLRNLLGSVPADGRGWARGDVAGRTAVIERGTAGYLVALVQGGEPPLLPLYMVEVLREIEDDFGPRLRSWQGELSLATDTAAIVRKLLHVSASQPAAGPLEGHPLSRVPTLVARGDLKGEAGQEFTGWARTAIESRPFPAAVEFVKEIVRTVESPFEELNQQLREAVQVGREAGAVEVTDEQLQQYVGIVQDVLGAVLEAKQRAGIEQYWPVKRLAVKPDSQHGYDAVTAMRKVIVGQSFAKELDLVAPGETWQGMNIQVRVEMNSVSAAYKLWARKIEQLLRGQDAWKIKKGIERGEYAVGIDGQRVRIDPEMVSFTESLPGHVIEQRFKGGVVYLDGQMTPDLLSEGYAKEVVNVIRNARNELRLPETADIATVIRASEALQRQLRSWRDFILRETRSVSLDFTEDEVEGGYVVEVTLGEESFLVSVRPVET